MSHKKKKVNKKDLAIDSPILDVFVIKVSKHGKKSCKICKNSDVKVGKDGLCAICRKEME